MTTATVDKSGATDKSSQASQAAKLDAIIADLDFSDVPEAVRNEVIAKVKDKVKLYDAGFRAKSETLAEEKKRLESDKQTIKALLDIHKELKDNPKMEEAVIKVINDFRSGKTRNSETNRDTNIKRLDKLIENATDPDTREQLREMRQIVIEETNAPATQAKLVELEEEIKRLKSSTLSNHADKVDADINSLEEKYGKEFISKYREDIKASALKYPNQRVNKLLYHFADDSELEEAMFKVAEAKKKKELENKKNGSLPDGRSMSTKVDVPKDSHGRVNWRGLISNMKSAGKFS